MSSLNYPQTKSFDRLQVQVYDRELDLVTSLVTEVETYLKSVINTQGEATIIFASGSSQIKFLTALTASSKIDWSKVTCFHLDEYLGISGTHPASFQNYITADFRIPINRHRCS